METRLVRVQDIADEDDRAWRRLAGRVAEPNPFSEPDFFRLAVAHFADYRDASIVVVQDGSEFVGVLPIAAFESPRLPPRRVATTKANPAAVSCLQTPLVDVTRAREVVDAIVGALGSAARGGGWPGIVLLDEISADGPVANALTESCARRRFPVVVRDSWERAIVTRGGTWADPVSGKHRREITRRHRRLAEDTAQEVALLDRSADPAVCDAFLALETSGWKGQGRGQAFARYPHIAAWLNEWHRCLLDAGRVTVLSLEVGPAPIAMAYVVRAGGGLFFFRQAFDESYAKYGPGQMLLYLALSHLRDHTDADWVDSATSKGDQFFSGLLSERRAMTRLMIGTGSVLDRCALRLLPAMTSALSVLRERRRPAASSSPSAGGDTPAEAGDVSADGPAVTE